MYFPFFEPQPGSKRSAVQPQTIYSEFTQTKVYHVPEIRVKSARRKCRTIARTLPLALYSRYFFFKH